MSQDTSALNASSGSEPITLSLDEQHTLLRLLRSEILEKYRPHIKDGAGPIRVMARIVDELTRECRQRHISEDILREEIVNRTIGDIDLRKIAECEGEWEGPYDYRMLADEIGLALPGENCAGYVAKGETYLWLREKMQECEWQLLEQGIDLRIYDIYGTGNVVMRSWLAEDMQKWGLDVSEQNINLSLGAMDGIDKTLRGLAHIYRTQGITDIGILFPEPGFGVPEWQAGTYGYTLHRFSTSPQQHFKITGAQLDQILAENPDIHVIYLIIINNPTAFGYTAEEMNEIHAVLRRYREEQGRRIYLLADIAYVGTAQPEEDQARMTTFAAPDVLQHTIFVGSFSKTFTLTGERFGWVTCGDPAITSGIGVSWTNGTAALPGEWQLRYMAYYQLFQSRPWLQEKLRRFYRLRRRRFIEQLRRIDARQHLFEEIYVDDDATVYNWSKLLTGEDAFSLFEKTGIAGVPGSGFGYTDEYIRFSIGVIPVEQDINE